MTDWKFQEFKFESENFKLSFEKCFEMWVSCGLSGSAHIFEFNRSAFYILLFLLQIFFIKHQKCPIIEFNSQSLPDGFSTFEFSRCKNQLLSNEINQGIYKSRVTNHGNIAFI